MFRNLKLKSEVIYLPKYKNIPAQDSELCYYFSYLHLLASHDLQKAVPHYIKDMVNEMKTSPLEKHNDIIVKTIIKNADDLLWIADEIYNENNNMNDGANKEKSESDDEYESENETENDGDDWAADFFSKYGIEISIAKLLNLNVSEFSENDFCCTQLQSILLKHGPIAIGSMRATKLPAQKQTMFAEFLRPSNSGTYYNVYYADDCSIEGAHYTLVIGCQTLPNQRVYFIDPNYPDHILSMDFQEFKSNLSVPEYVYQPGSKLKPDNAIHQQIANDFMLEESEVANMPHKGIGY